MISFNTFLSLKDIKASLGAETSLKRGTKGALKLYFIFLIGSACTELVLLLPGQRAKFMLVTVFAIVYIISVPVWENNHRNVVWTLQFYSYSSSFNPIYMTAKYTGWFIFMTVNVLPFEYVFITIWRYYASGSWDVCAPKKAFWLSKLLVLWIFSPVFQNPVSSVYWWLLYKAQSLLLQCKYRH